MHQLMEATTFQEIKSDRECQSDPNHLADVAGVPTTYVSTYREESDVCVTCSRSTFCLEFGCIINLLAECPKNEHVSVHMSQ